jgi:choice-of-anchor A domain-containing protein
VDSLLNEQHAPVVCDNDSTSALTKYGLVTVSDLLQLSTVEGRLLVVGNFDSSVPTAVGTSISASAVSPSTVAALEIVGTVRPGVTVRVDRGSVTVSSEHSISATTPWEYRVNKEGRIRLMDDRAGATITTDHGIADHALRTCRSLMEYSQRLWHLTGDNPVHFVPVIEDGGVAVDVTLEVTKMDDSDVAVFSIDANVVFGSKTRSLEINNRLGAKMIIVNVGGIGGGVAGQTLQLTADLRGSWLRSKLGQSRTLWNIYDPAEENSTSIDLQTKVFKGALLAPFSDVRTSASIHGSVVAKTLASTDDVKLPTLDFSFCIENGATNK